MHTEKNENSDFLNKEIKELESYIPYSDKINNQVSNVGVAWHLDHTLKVINSVFNALEKSKPEKYKWRPNFLRSIVFIIGKFGRGRGKSPKIVLPPEVIEKQNIVKQLEEAKSKLLALESLVPKVNFVHPYFGLLNKKDTKIFLKIHTKHHLSIIKDIVEKKH